MELYFNEAINQEGIEVHQEVEKNGGRIEQRICKKSSDVAWLSEHKWPGLKTIFSVRRIFTSKAGTTDETSYYITSLDTTASELLHISRAHWKIESMHWMLDEDFSEDECRLLSDNGQKTLNAFRKLALLIHRNFMAQQPKKQSIKSNLLRCLLSEQALLELVGSL